MSGKLSKTAKASMGKSEKKIGKRCQTCSEPMVATRVIKASIPGGTYLVGQTLDICPSPGGMYWICQKCNHRERIKK